MRRVVYALDLRCCGDAAAEDGDALGERLMVCGAASFVVFGFVVWLEATAGTP